MVDSFPWSFLETSVQLTNFSTTGVVLARSDPVPIGFIGFVREADIVFTTTGGGVFLQVRHPSGGVHRVTQNYTGTSSGFVFIVQAGDRIELVLQATGAGVIDLVLQGEIQERFSAQKIEEVAKKFTNPFIQFPVGI